MLLLLIIIYNFLVESFTVVFLQEFFCATWNKHVTNAMLMNALVKLCILDS